MFRPLKDNIFIWEELVFGVKLALYADLNIQEV